MCGERSLGRKAFVWLFINYPQEFQKVVHLLPEYGRWDDLFVLWCRILDLKLSSPEHIAQNYASKKHSEDVLSELHDLQVNLIKMFGDQLIQDRENMLQNQPISLCAKWAPSEKGSLNKKYDIRDIIRGIMNDNTLQIDENYESNTVDSILVDFNFDLYNSTTPSDRDNNRIIFYTS